VDTNNVTGYAQIVEELVNGAVVRKYTCGLSLISKRETTPAKLSFDSYDGHGSVRQLTDFNGNVTDTYDYDAFGNLISSTGATTNNYLFAGEQYDPDLGLYYNRARYLDVRSGRFWGMDTFEGDPEAPLSLHRYLYDLADPVNQSDPSGYITDLFLSALYGQRVHELIGEHFEAVTGGLSNRTVRTIIGIGNFLRPDLVNVATGEVYEIKPTAAYVQGLQQLSLYLAVLNILDPEKRRWVPGYSYAPPPVLQLTSLTLAFVQVPIGGVITYNVRNLAADVLSIAGALAALSAQINLDIGAATLTARYV
jgi:RHS repeat-associated protein